MRLKEGKGGGSDTRGKDNWLLIKRSDEAARGEGEFDVVRDEPASVKSGRLLGEVANGKLGPQASKNRKPRSAKTTLNVSDFPVQLATLAAEPPEGAPWLHEIKFDGYRLLALVEHQSARLYTRSALDWTRRYPAVTQAMAQLPVQSAVLDGELVVLDETGVSRFQLLQNTMDTNHRLAFFAFDLLHLDGEDLRKLPLAKRKDRLVEILGSSEAGPLRYSDHFADRGPEFFSACCRRGLEGIVSKRADRPYEPGRSHDWLKIKCLGHEELVIGGFTDSSAAQRPLGSLLLGYFQDGQWVYAGRVGTGFDAAALRSLHSRLHKLQQSRCPFVELPPRERGSGLHWVRPELVAQIEFAGWTEGGVLRHASFQGLREDKDAKSVGPPASLVGPAREENDMPPSGKRKRPAPRKAKGARAKTATKVSAVPVTMTHPERVLFPDVGLTKRDLADYYAAVADAMLPHIADRPLSLLRCPEGASKACFFQKHAAAGTPAILRRVPIQERDDVEEYLVVDNAAGLTALAQMSVLEIHPWGSCAEQLEQPDRLIFDLDPGPDVEWKAVVEAALLLRDVLGRLDLATFVKTSGGKGLHVVAPLAGRTTWPTLKQFARAVAEHLAEQEPARYTAKMAKAARKGRVFLDYLRNDRGATAVAPYSPRARAGAPISLPLAWEELSGKVRGDTFKISSWRERLSDSPPNPWKGFFTLKQRLPKFAGE